jgi:hypothetical protein
MLSRKMFLLGAAEFGLAVGAGCGKTAAPLADASNAVCQPAPDAAEPDVVALGDGDAGLPLDQMAHAYAVVRCGYFSRCSPLASYFVDECISAMTETGGWNFTQGSVYYPANSDLTRAVASGLVTYDERAFAACLQALQTQSCHGSDLWLNIPACANVFTCSSDTGTGDGGSTDGAGGAIDDGGRTDGAGGGTNDGGPTDGAVTCADLYLTKGTKGATLVSCSATADCAAISGAPHCVDGYCARSACGDASYPCPGVAAGAPCDSDAPFLGSSLKATPWGTIPAKTCPPGLTCRGLAAGNKMGVCTPPEDVGGTCDEGAASTGCSYGLVCRCGKCQIPPVQGPCASGTCKMGMSYCRSATNTCAPVNQLGGDCSDFQMCSPNLDCNVLNNTCVPFGTL